MKNYVIRWILRGFAHIIITIGVCRDMQQGKESPLQGKRRMITWYGVKGGGGHATAHFSLVSFFLAAAASSSFSTS